MYYDARSTTHQKYHCHFLCLPSQINGRNAVQTPRLLGTVLLSQICDGQISPRISRLTIPARHNFPLSPKNPTDPHPAVCLHIFPRILSPLSSELHVPRISHPFNLLAPDFCLILAHPVHKMWIIQEPNTSELWNKLHFEKEKKRTVHTKFKIFSTYICWIYKMQRLEVSGAVWQL